MDFIKLAYVMFGGALGAGARFSANHYLTESIDWKVPPGTLAVNVVGSFLLGLVLEGGVEYKGSWLSSDFGRFALGVGFCGAFTTFSTFSVQTLRLVQAGETLPALANVGYNCIVCFIAAALGVALIRALA